MCPGDDITLTRKAASRGLEANLAPDGRTGSTPPGTFRSAETYIQ
jgi:hypothetical protein